MTESPILGAAAIVLALRDQNEILRIIASSLDSIDRGLFELNAGDERS